MNKLLQKYFIIFASLALIPLLGFAYELNSEDNIQYNLECCLLECYHIDHRSADVIMSKFTPLIEDINSHHIINEFIRKSKNLNIVFSGNKPNEVLQPDDAILKASDWHKILFESCYVRIFLGYSKPGEREPFHRHQWKRIMVMLQDATFKIENDDGSTMTDIWPMGVYELPPETLCSAYTNIGNTEFRALIFEVKN